MSLTTASSSASDSLLPNPPIAPSAIKLEGTDEETRHFLDRGDGNQVIVRMRGLPFDTTAQQIYEFFTEGDPATQILDGPDGVLFVRLGDGRATGDAFVMFENESDADVGLKRNKETIGTRYIELFRSTTAEVQQVCKRSSVTVKNSLLNSNKDPNSSSPSEVGGHSLSSLSFPTIGPSMLSAAVQAMPPPNTVMSTVSQMAANSHSPYLIPNVANQIAMLPPTLAVPTILSTATHKKDCIRLRGLPYEAKIEHILEFLGIVHSSHILPQGVHMVFNAQGSPSGEAFIQMDSEHSAAKTVEQKHCKNMCVKQKRRYIEVMQCSVDDMNNVLAGASAKHQASQAAAAAAAAAAALSLQIPAAQFALNSHHSGSMGGGGHGGAVYASPAGIEHLYVMMGGGGASHAAGRHGAPPTSAFGPQPTGIMAPPPPSITPTQLNQPYFQGAMPSPYNPSQYHNPQYSQPSSAYYGMPATASAHPYYGSATPHSPLSPAANVYPVGAGAAAAFNAAAAAAAAAASQPHQQRTPTLQTSGSAPGVAAAAANSNGGGFYPPVFYYYPSPPVSPSSSYYSHQYQAQPTAVQGSSSVNSLPALPAPPSIGQATSASTVDEGKHLY